jgi:hypothetical protein
VTSPTAELVELAVTVRLPWAAAIRAAAYDPTGKLIENRGRPVADKYLGRRVGIHGAAAWSKPGGTDRRVLRLLAPVLGEIEPADMNRWFRHVIAVATLVDCHPARQPRIVGDRVTCCRPWGERWYGENSKPAWHLQFDQVVLLGRPVGPIVGSLSVPWKLSPTLAAAVTAEYSRSPR